MDGRDKHGHDDISSGELQCPSQRSRSSLLHPGRSHIRLSNSDFPYGVFSVKGGLAPRVGVAIGDYVLDLWELEQDGRLDVGDLGCLRGQPDPFMALGPNCGRAPGHGSANCCVMTVRICAIMTGCAGWRWCRWRRQNCICPIAVAGYTDFYSSKEHATNVGVMFRGKDNALQPNWLHMPIGYNGRASTVVVSGTKVRRPRGQLKPPNAELPGFGPCKRLDFELEMGVVIGQQSPMGEMLDEKRAAEMIFGFVLLNDWSARDIQQWEYVPLGPFQAKAFATSISPWVVTREALEPFRLHGPEQDPAPLPYLLQAQPNNYDLQLDVGLRAAQMNEPTRICRTNFKYMYWSSVQQLVHHASSGCAMNIGDLLGSGTISGRKTASAAVCLKSHGTAPSRLNYPVISSGRSSKTAIPSVSMAGARAMAIASALVRSRGRSCRRND